MILNIHLNATFSLVLSNTTFRLLSIAFVFRVAFVVVVVVVTMKTVICR